MPKYSEEIINFKRLVTILERCFLYLKHNGVNTKFHFFCQKSSSSNLFLDIYILSFFFEQLQKFPELFYTFFSTVICLDKFLMTLLSNRVCFSPISPRILRIISTQKSYFGSFQF